MNSNWLHRILKHTETPPEGAWKSICATLDEEGTVRQDLQAKLQQYEVAPPVAVMENIFNRVAEDDDAALQFPERILNYSQEPPRTAWKNIVTQLDEDSGKVVPLIKNTRTMYLRAAAAVLIIIAGSVWILSKQKTGIGEEQAVVKPKNQLITLPDSNSGKTAPAPAPTAEKQTPVDALAYQPGNRTLSNPSALLDTLSSAYVPGHRTENLALAPAPGNKEKLQNGTGETPMDISLMNTPNTYISVTGPDGQTVKVSSKFSNLISYLNEENTGIQENLDLIIKESAKWRATFAAWRKKMANNEVAPSLTNFMDIVELSKVLEEKK